MPPYAVSACLCGIPCRYNATHALCKQVQQLVVTGKAIAVCPEVLGNLPTPRLPVEIQGERVFDKLGNDFTQSFVDGAEKALELCLKFGCHTAILKSRSPSCGRGFIYDGTFTGNLVKGNGFWAKLLQEHNIKIYTEEDLPPML